jgi:hypothetical protein
MVKTLMTILGIAGFETQIAKVRESNGKAKGHGKILIVEDNSRFAEIWLFC